VGGGSAGKIYPNFSLGLLYEVPKEESFAWVPGR
jgi:hypothetical protein